MTRVIRLTEEWNGYPAGTEYELAAYIADLRGPALREKARSLGLAVKSRTPVADIREAIRVALFPTSYEYVAPGSAPVAEVPATPAESAVERPVAGPAMPKTHGRFMTRTERDRRAARRRVARASRRRNR